MASINPIASSPLRPEQRLSTRDDLFSAIRENNLPRVQELIEQGINFKARDQDGNGPLYWALINDKPEITRLLLQKGADPNEKMNRPYAYTALHMIAERKANFHALLLQELCDRRADLNARAYGQLTPLMVAAYRGNTPMVSFLADKGADVHLRDAHDNTALHWAVQPWQRNFQECAKMIKILLQKEIDPNTRAQNNSTPLHSLFRRKEAFFLLNERVASAISFPHPNPNPSSVWNVEEEDEVVSLLLEGGANPNLQDSQGDTILHLAAQYGGPRSVFLLLKKGANPEIANTRGEKAIDSILKMQNAQGLTAIYFAAAMGHADIISLLLKHGADPNATTRLGETPLHFAARNGHAGVISLLLTHGANPNAVNQGGETPAHYAAKNGQVQPLLVLLGKAPAPNEQPVVEENPQHYVNLFE